MKLDLDAADYLRHFDAALPRPLHEMGVEAGRAMRIAGSAPSGPQLSSVEDVELGYPAHLDRPFHSSVGPLRGRVYRPEPVSDAPALVYLHGGGWSIGSLDGVDAVCRVLAARSGCVVLSVDYRQAPEHPYPAPLADAWRAIRWVTAGGLAGVDPNRVGVGGDSAGANLAAACTILARDAGEALLAGQLLVYPPTDALDESASMRECALAPVLTADDVRWFRDLYLPPAVDRTRPTVSPKRAESLSGLPPAAVFTAEYDPIRDDGEEYAALLAEAGVPVVVRRVEGVYHGFFPLVGVLSAADRVAEEAATWLRGVLG